MATDSDELDPQLARAVQGLTARDPDVDLWPGIASRLHRRRRGIVSMSWPLAAAAAAVLITGSAYVTVRLVTPGSDTTSQQLVVNNSLVLPAGYDLAEASLGAAIADLERVFELAVADLEPDTRAQLDRSLTALDNAIADARRRAGAAPDDLEAARYLTHTMRRKLAVLRTVATMPTRT